MTEEEIAINERLNTYPYTATLMLPGQVMFEVNHIYRTEDGRLLAGGQMDAPGGLAVSNHDITDLQYTIV